MITELLFSVKNELDRISEIISESVPDNMFDLSITMPSYHVIVIYDENKNNITVNKAFAIDTNDSECMLKIGKFEVCHDEGYGYRYDAYVTAPSEDVAKAIAYTAFNDYNKECGTDVYIDSDSDDEKEQTYTKVVGLILNGGQDMSVKIFEFEINDSQHNVPEGMFVEYPNSNNSEYYVFLKPGSETNIMGEALLKITSKRPEDKFPYRNLSKEGQKILDKYHESINKKGS